MPSTDGPVGSPRAILDAGGCWTIGFSWFFSSRHLVDDGWRDLSEIWAIPVLLDILDILMYHQIASNIIIFTHVTYVRRKVSLPDQVENSQSMGDRPLSQGQEIRTTSSIFCRHPIQRELNCWSGRCFDGTAIIAIIVQGSSIAQLKYCMLFGNTAEVWAYQASCKTSRCSSQTWRAWWVCIAWLSNSTLFDIFDLASQDTAKNVRAVNFSCWWYLNHCLVGKPFECCSDFHGRHADGLVVGATVLQDPSSCTFSPWAHVFLARDGPIGGVLRSTPVPGQFQQQMSWRLCPHQFSSIRQSWEWETFRGKKLINGDQWCADFSLANASHVRNTLYQHVSTISTVVWSHRHRPHNLILLQISATKREDLGYSTDCQPGFFCTNRRGWAPFLYLHSFCSWFLSNHHFHFVVVYVELVEASNIKSTECHLTR